MIAKVLVWSLLVAAACASPLTSTVNYGDAVTTFIQALKKMAPCGYAAEDIPILDPMINEFSSFNYTRGETILVGNASNIRISGLSKAVILNGQYDDNTLQATFDILFPELQFLGSTIVEGVINMMGFSLPTRQNTLINERLEQLRFVGGYTFGQSLTNPNGLQITDLKLQFYLADVRIDNWDTLWNISSNKFNNQWSRALLLLLAEEVQPNVDQLMAQYVLPGINELLSNVTMTQLTSFLVSTANAWNSANCNVLA